MVSATSRTHVTCKRCGGGRGVWRAARLAHLCEPCAEEAEYLQPAALRRVPRYQRLLERPVPESRTA